MPDSPTRRLMTWWMIMRIALSERLAYRGDFALGTLMRFLPIITQIFLWAAVFQSVEEASGKTSGKIRSSAVTTFLRWSPTFC